MTTQEALNASANADAPVEAGVEVTQAMKDEMDEGLAPWCVKFRTQAEYKQGSKR